MVRIKANVIIVSEIITEPLVPLPKNSVDVVRLSTPLKIDVVGPSALPKDLVYVVGPSMPPP